jgi:hypothetical protein
MSGQPKYDVPPWMMAAKGEDDPLWRLSQLLRRSGTASPSAERHSNGLADRLDAYLTTKNNATQQDGGERQPLDWLSIFGSRK